MVGLSKFAGADGGGYISVADGLGIKSKKSPAGFSQGPLKLCSLTFHYRTF